MSNQKEEASASLQNIANFFGANGYSVPKYQRDYAWKTRQISELLDDLWQFAISPDSYYVLGQVITTPVKNGSDIRNLVDGQQRITSLYLLLLAIQRRNRALHVDSGFGPSGQAIEDQIVGLLWTWSGTPPSRTPRFQSVENGKTFLHELIMGVDHPTIVSVSDRNLKSNFEFIKTWLGEQKKLSTADQLWTFTCRILQDVKLVNLRLPSEDRAIDFFIKLNSRGVKLNAADLLKSLILKNANDQDYLNADEVWKKISNSLEAAKKLPGAMKMPTGAANMEFLLGALIRKRTGLRYSKDQLFSAWEGQITKKHTPFDSEPTLTGKLSVNEFIDLLAKDGQDFRAIGTGFKPVRAGGGLSQNLVGTRTFKAIQHFNVLMGGTNLEKAAYEQLEKLVEARTIIQIFSEEPSQDFEKILPKWASRIHKLGAEGSVQDVVKESLESFKGVEQLIQRIPSFVSRLRYSNTDGRPRQSDIDRIRYVLARANHRAEIRAGENYSGIRMFMETTAGEGLALPRDIDHILAKSDKSVKANWSDLESTEALQSIGNLALLSSSVNQKSGDTAPANKEEQFGSGKEPLLTIALSHSKHMSAAFKKNPEIQRLQERVTPQLDSWGQESIDLRRDLYVELFLEDIRDACAGVL